MRKALGRFLVITSILPSAVFALGLGDIKLQSALNAPLDAEIQLVGATPDELATLKTQLASRDTFTRYGLEWPSFLNSVTVTRARSADGREVLRVHSADAITEPFVTFLVEANWARGRLVREYTVLLDPPVYTPNAAAAPAAAAVAPAVSGVTETSAPVVRAPETPVAAPQPRPVAPPSSAVAPPSAASAPTGAGGSYRVRRGDTLFGISRGVAGGGIAETRRAMVSIFRTNRAAFDGNMNILRAGALLRMPDPSAFAEISPADAAAEIRSQSLAWNARGGAAPRKGTSGQLKLVPPGAKETGGGVTPGAAPTAQVEDLRSKVRDLQSQLDDSRRLLEMRNADLAKMQAQLAAAQAQKTQAPPPAPVAMPPAQQAPPAAAPTVPPVAATPEPEQAPPAMEPAPTPTPPAVPEKAPVKAVRPPVTEAPGKSWADTLKAFWFVPILLLAGLGGLVAYRKYQAKQSAAFDETLGRLASEDTQDRLRALDSDDTTRLRKPTGTAGDSFVVEESGAHQRPAALAPVAAAPPPVKTEDTISSESAINLDQSDPLAEADFHMAYGLYDQASDLVRMAIAREPDRRDLKLKLLEVFFVWGNRDQFLATAHELAATRANAAPGEWDKIVIMGKQIAADDSLFSQSGGYSAAGASGVDLDLEGGQNRVDFDVAAEPAGAGGDGGMMAGRKESTAEHTASSSSAVDFLLDDPGRGGDLGGDAARDSTAEMPIDADSPLGAVWAAADGSDAPTVEQPAIRGGDSPTIRQKVEHALRQSPKADQTAEVALDDLGLDLGADEAEHADLGEEEPSSDVPTMVAGFDARSKRLIDEAERRVSVTPAATMSGTWLVEDEPAGSVDTGVTAEMPRSVDTGVTAELPRTVGAGGHTGDTSQIAALKVDDLDLDLGGAEPAAGARSDATAVQTRRISTEEMALPDLEPVTMSEVGTKLDLARAYMDMGDPDGARSILQEVLAEGSVSQKQEAQRLMQTLPG